MLHVTKGDQTDLQRLVKLSQDAPPAADVSELDGISQKRSAHNDTRFFSRWREEKKKSLVLAKTVFGSSDKWGTWSCSLLAGQVGGVEPEVKEEGFHAR